MKSKRPPIDQQYRPDRVDAEYGPRFFCDALGALRHEAADAQGGALPDFAPNSWDQDDPYRGPHLCTGDNADLINRLINPGYMLRWSGAVLAATIEPIPRLATTSICAIREVAHHPASRGHLEQTRKKGAILDYLRT